MINPKNTNSSTKCRNNCRIGNICAPCLTFRKSFKVGQIITWGICVANHRILEIHKEYIVVSIVGAETCVPFSDLNLKVVNIK